jgi:hypothetical protein
MLTPTMTSEASDKAKVVRTLNWLLRGEISTSHTYGLAIPQVAARPGDVEVLRTIAKEHENAVESIRAAIERAGGTPEENSTAWPSPVKPVTGPGRVFVEAAALKALRDAEEHGLKDYRHALEQLNAENGALIREALIPARLKNIDELEAMIARL